MAKLNFYQIYPYQTQPILAKDTPREMPIRAKQFCLPFVRARNKGVLCSAPLSFRFLQSESVIKLEVFDENTGNTLYELSVSTEIPSNNNLVLLSHYDQNRSTGCLRRYRNRIPDEVVPDGIDKNNFGFYEVMLNVIVEEPPFGCFIQVWLGGVITTDSGDKCIQIKNPSNVNFDAGFVSLDAEVDTGKWQNWLAILIKPTRSNEWVTIDTNTPICQIDTGKSTIDEIHFQSFDDIDDSVFLNPIHWHIFDSDYSVKPGKYLRAVKQRSSNK